MRYTPFLLLTIDNIGELMQERGDRIGCLLIAICSIVCVLIWIVGGFIEHLHFHFEHEISDRHCIIFHLP